MSKTYSLELNVTALPLVAQNDSSQNSTRKPLLIGVKALYATRNGSLTVVFTYPVTELTGLAIAL